MPLPVGFQEEQVATIPQGFQPEVNMDTLPAGFVPADKATPEISQAPQKSIFDKMVGFFKDPERDIAKAQNIYALSETTGLPLQEVNKNYEILRRSSKVTGITPDLNNREYMQMVMLPAVAVGAVTNPIGTAAGLIAFGALDKAIPTDKLVDKLRDKGISDDVTSTIELADFIGKSMIVGGVFKKAPQVAEGFLKQKIVDYKLPSTVTLSSTQVKDIFQTGKLTTPEQQSLFGSLGLNSYDLRAALDHGVNINVPAEKIVGLVDKPYWAKVKGMMGIVPETKTTSIPAGEVTKAPAGLLEQKPLNIIGKNKILSAYQRYSEITPNVSTSYKTIGELYKTMGFEREFAKSTDIKVYVVDEPGSISDKNADGFYNEANNVIYVKSNLNEKRFNEVIRHELIHSLGFDEVTVEKAMAGGYVPEKNTIGQSQSSVNPVIRVIDALKESKSVRGQQETLYKKARAQKFAKMQAVGSKVQGEKGYYAQLGALKGELPRAEFESIRAKLTQEDIDSLFNMVKDSPQIGEWDKLAARSGLAKLFGEMGGKVPTENEISLLNKVFGSEFTEAVLSKRTWFEKAKDMGLQIANVPRSIMSSFDLSAPFRQGIFLVGRPKQFWPSFAKMFQAFKGEEGFQAIQDSIIRHPDYQLARDAKLALTDVDVLIGEREEAFQSNLAEKIPVLGKGIRASGRAYVGFLNKLRFDTFSDLVNKAETAGFNPRENADLTKAIAEFVNNATGRGTLPGGLQRAAVNLNALFFSPRLIASRLNLLNPNYYVKQTPFVRKEALKSLFSFVGFGLTVLTLAKLAGAEVGSDPRSSDFGKIKIGNTRIDVWGGFQQLSVAASRLVTGKYISSTTGKEMTLGEGYKPMTRADIIQRFLESKLAPIPSFITAMLKSQDATGQEVSMAKEVANRFIPMVLQDTYDLAQESPGLLPLSVLGAFGFGVQTYEEKGRF